jgi:hypothetical protein
VRTVRLDALAVQRERMVAQLEALVRRDPPLPLLDLGVDEFLDAAAGQADEVIVVRTCSNCVSTR